MTIALVTTEVHDYKVTQGVPHWELLVIKTGTRREAKSSKGNQFSLPSNLLVEEKSVVWLCFCCGSPLNQVD